MADVNANIGVNIDTSAALANLKNLQRQISVFHTSMAKSGAAASAVSAGYQQNLINSINQSGKFSASMKNIRSTTESFTNSLEKNKLGMREYFRYSAASTKTFGRFFRTEFDTINKVARERVKTLQTQYIKMGRDANGAMKAIAVRPLALDMKSLATQTQIAAQRQALFNQLVRQGSTNLLNFGKNTQWAGRQLMVGFTVPLTMLGAVAAKTFMQIEEQAIRFKKVYGEMFTTDVEVDKAINDIQNLAKEFTKYGIAVEKTIQMAADAAQAGFMGKALEAQVTQATRLAILGGMEQEKALENTIALQNAFRVSTEDLASSINFLNAVENQTVLSLDDVSEAIPRVGPIITELGGDIRDLTFFLTAMKEGGVSAAQGANALKAGLGRLINPSKNATQYLDQLGISLSSIIENNAGDLRATVMSFARAIEPLDELTKARAVEKVFGKFQFARTLALLNNITRDGTQASRVLKLTAASVEELAILAERELGQVEESTTFRFKKAVEEIKASIAPIGGEFLKALTPIIKIGTKILDAFNNLDSGAKTLIVNITGIVGVIGPVFLMMFGLVANGFANLIKMFAFLGKAFTGTRSSTTDLAAQTQYMTQEQLEAAAVAASLDQTHMKLRQTFTSEASAVNALTSAYQKATVAQSGFNAAAVARARPGAGRVPAKYASGVLSVPGPKGAGDIVPAMLSPGEAVIPAKQARKYSGIVSSLISDNVPGFKLGRNPFASMLGRSQVATRMSSENFMSALRSSGKDARYQSAFTTGTGADYFNKSGSPNPKQKLVRSSMERDLFGLDPKTTAASSRPTYGYARTSILQSLVNNLFGIKGKNFNAITAGSRGKSLDLYGNIDLVTKSSVAKRSSSYLGDTLMDYVRTVEGRTRRYPNFNTRHKDLQMPLSPMRGASQADMLPFKRLGSPFGANKRPGENSYWTNAKSPYVETQTPGGFAFKEIDRVIARDPAIAKQLKQELKAAGLGAVRVVGSGFVSRLFKNMGVPGFSSGTRAVTGSTDGKYWLDFLGKRFDLTGPRPKYYAEKLPETIEIMRGQGRSDESISRRIQSLYERGRPLVPSDVNNQATMGGKKHQFTVSGGSQYGVDTLTSNVKKSGMFNAETRFLEAEAKKLGISKGQLARFAMVDAAHFSPKGAGVKDWKDISKIGPDTGGINNYLNRVGGNLGKNLLARDDQELKKLKIDRKELEKLVAGNHPSTKASALTLKSIAQFDEKTWSKNSRNKQVREGSYQATLTRKLLDLRFKNKLYERGLRSYSELISQKVIKDTRTQSNLVSGTDKRVPSGVGVKGGSASDTRMAAVSPGETILTKKTNRELMSGRPVSIPGFGRLGRLSGSSSNFPRLPGFADGFPEGQTPDRRSSGISQSYGMSSKDWDKATRDEQAKLRAQRKQAEAAEKQRRIAETNARIADEQKVAEEKKKLAVKEEKRALRQSKMRGMGGKVAGGVGALAMVGAIGGSMMGGQIGEIASQLMMPVMMMSMMLPMLSSLAGIPLVIALVVAALGGLAAAAFMLDQQFKENVKKAYEFETAMGSGTSAIQPLAEAAGNVTATEIMDRRRSSALDPFEIQPGKTTFGQNFVQSDAGEALKSTVSESFVKLGKDASVSKLVNQMATAIMSGAISPAQARSVVAALAQELGDVDLGVQVNAKLISLLGPNGENLLIDGVEIRAKIIQGAREDVKLTPKLTTVSAKAEAGAIGSFVANSVSALQAGKQATDSLDLEYEQKIKNAKATLAAAKTEEEKNKATKTLNDLEKKFQEDRSALLQENIKTADKIKAELAPVQNKRDVIDAFRTQTLQKFQDDPTALGLLGEKGKGGLLDRIDTEGKDKLTADQSIILNAELLAGNISPLALNNLLNGENTEAVVDIVTKFGGTEANRVFEIANLIENEDLKAQFLVDVEGKTPEELGEYLSGLEDLYKLTASSTAGKIIFEAMIDGGNDDLRNKIKAQQDSLQDLAEKGPITFETVQEIVNKGTPNGEDVMEVVEANRKYFDGLSDEDKIKYVQSITIAANLEGDPAITGLFKSWQLEKGGSFSETTGRVMGGGTFQEFLHEKLGFPITQAGTDNTGDNEKAVETPTTGGAKKESPYKNILKDLKELRQDAVNAAGSVQELLKWLGKGKDMRPFKGTLNALVAAGTTEEFQSFISGLDKSEQDKLFKVSKGVAKLSKEGKAVQKAFNEISIGGFVIEQQRAIANAKNQEIAAKRLIAAGMDTSDAYEAVKDSMFAAGIAAMKLGKKGREELKSIVNSAKEAGKAIIKAMTADELSSVLKESLQNAVEKIEIDFEFSTSADKSIVAAAQAEIAALQFQIDDYQAGLQEIEWEEDEINKKYDKRSEALDKIKEINSEIASQQKGQLSVAEAITRGDLAATARAVQELRESQAASAAERQQRALEISRENELGRVRSSKGKSRLELEEEILKKEKEIFKIEEDRLEPAQERIRLLDVERQKAVDSLNLQMLSYDRLVNKIDAAKFATKSYADLLKEALATLQKMAGIELPGGGSSGNTRPGPEKDGSFVGQLGPQGNFVWDGKNWVKVGSNAGQEILAPNPNFKPTPGNLRPGPEKDGTKPGQIGPGGNFVWNGVQWVKLAGGGKVSYYPMGGKIPYKAAGGIMGYYPMGGMIPYKADGGMFNSVNSDSVPAMLTPGEYVIKRQMVNKYGTKLFDKLNSGMVPGLEKNRYRFNTPNFSPRSSKINIDPSANSGGVVATSNNSSVYNYSLSVNVSSMSDPNTIAQTVMGQIRRVDAQRLRGNRF
jgi:TP901 family phage tail tape measure protein